MNSTGATPTPIDKALYREVIGRFATGVTVITTRVGEKDFGTTASAFTSLSMEPPMLLVCLNRTSETKRAIVEAGCFGVNILGQGQEDIAYAFAKKSPDKFRDHEVVRGNHQIPLFPGSLAQLQCTVTETATGGTHTVFMGLVEEASARDGEPLAYYRGRFGRFEDTLQDEAYRRIRRLVITREIPPGEALDVSGLAASLGLEETYVFYALTKLTTDGLVERRSDGQLIVRPLYVRRAHDALDARCAIEIAVVDRVAGNVDPADLAILRQHAQAADEAATSRPPDIQKSVEEGREFHTRFIGLLDNETLLAFYQRHDLTPIWRRAAPSIRGIEPGTSNAAYLTALVESCAAGDKERAKNVLYAHAEGAKQRAREAIEALGGEI